MRGALPALMGALAIAGGCSQDSERAASSSGGSAGSSSGGSAGSSSGGSAGVVDAGDIVQKLTAALEADGFTVQEGKFLFADISACEKLPSCFGNNPTSPYGQLWLPPAPGQAAVNGTPDADGHSVVWRLRQDEAVIYVGRTPPAARYFGFTSYLFDREKAGGGRDVVFGSLGDTLNHLVFASDAPAGGSNFDRDAYFVATGHKVTDAKVRAAFQAAGVAPAHVNTDPLAPPVMKMGLGQSADTFSLLMRVALFADGPAGDAYVKSPPGTVLRVTPKSELAPDAFGMPTLRKKGTGQDESTLGAAVDALDAAIRAKHSTLKAFDPGTSAVSADGYACIQGSANCNGDNRDALYSVAIPGKLPATEQDFLIVFGVNHAKTGKATYANFSIYWLGKLLGVVSVEDGKFQGSADVYVPSHPDKDRLYAYKVARDCKGEAFCVGVPVDFPGVPLDAMVAVAWREYVEPQTETGPLASEMQLSRVIRFAP